DVSFVLVTSPAPMSLEEVVFFSERLEEAKMPRGAFVVNRFRLPPLWADRPPAPADAASAIQARGITLEEEGPARVVHAHADAVQLAALDAANVRRLNDRARGEVPIVRVAELAGDVRDLQKLGEIADSLMTGGV